jgi:hypothetical protein
VEEPFEIELLVPGSLLAHGTPDEEAQQQQEHDEDKDNEEYSPLSDTEGDKLYRDAEESPLLPSIKSKESHIQGWWSSRLSWRSSKGLR